MLPKWGVLGKKSLMEPIPLQLWLKFRFPCRLIGLPWLKSPVGICPLRNYRRVRPPSPMIVLDMTLILLMVRLHSWSFGECVVLLHYHYSQVHSIPVRIPSMSQIELFNHLLYLKLFNCANK